MSNTYKKSSKLNRELVNRAIEELKMGQGELQKRLELLQKEARIYRRAS